MGRPAKNPGELALHLSSAASQSPVGSMGVSTKARNDRPRRRMDGCGRTAIALVTAGPRGASILTGGLMRLARCPVNEGLTLSLASLCFRSRRALTARLQSSRAERASFTPFLQQQGTAKSGPDVVMSRTDPASVECKRAADNAGGPLVNRRRIGFVLGGQPYLLTYCSVAAGPLTAFPWWRARFQASTSCWSGRI